MMKVILQDAFENQPYCSTTKQFLYVYLLLVPKQNALIRGKPYAQKHYWQLGNLQNIAAFDQKMYIAKNNQFLVGLPLAVQGI